VSNPRTDNDHPVRARPLLDIAGCANYIASSVRHVRRMVAERTLPHYKVGHYVRFDPDELDEWLRQNRRGPNDGALKPTAPVPSTPRRRPAQAEPSDPSPHQLRLDS
jgi:excisionase family DNA binding protein